MPNRRIATMKVVILLLVTNFDKYVIIAIISCIMPLGYLYQAIQIIGRVGAWVDFRGLRLISYVITEYKLRLSAPNGGCG
jgi:hypothetical protein